MYIVYKHTSPSGKSYIGYTSKTLNERWVDKIRELRHRNTPLARALRKYSPETWTHETLFESPDKEAVLNYEISMISVHGDYNVAKGGNGGDTGRNGEPEKIAKQAKSLSEHWKSLTEEEKQRRIEASLNTRKENGTLGNCNPKRKESHGNWSGYWIVRGVKYTTSREAADKSGLNEFTVIDLCVHRVDVPAKRSSKLVLKGKTPRESGFYKSIT